MNTDTDLLRAVCHWRHTIIAMLEPCPVDDTFAERANRRASMQVASIVQSYAEALLGAVAAMTQPRQHAPDNGADRAPASQAGGVPVVADWPPATPWLIAFATSMARASNATAIRVRQHPSGKSTRAHDQRSVLRDLDDHVNGASKTCPKRTELG